MTCSWRLVAVCLGARGLPEGPEVVTHSWGLAQGGFQSVLSEMET